MACFWLTNINLVDVLNGAVEENINIKVSDGIITDILKTVNSEEKTIDMTGKYISPGLIDAHVHILGLDTIPPYAQVLRAYDYCKEYLKNGVVAARDLGTLCPNGGNTAAIEFSNAMKTDMGKYCCEIVTSGRSITATYRRLDISDSIIADTKDELTKAIRYLKSIGANLIKIMATGSGHDQHDDLCFYTLDEMKHIVSESHRLGMKVAVHAVSKKGIEVCIDACVDSIEHGPYINDEYLEKMKENSIYYVPTMGVYRHLAKHKEQAQITVHDHMGTVPNAYKKGIKIVTGSDNPGPFGFGGRKPQVLAEMLILEEMGLSKIACIRAATIHGAELLGIDDRLGSVNVGKEASFIVLNANPLESLYAYEDIHRVYKKGEIVV